jgi:hypothetical protein
MFRITLHRALRKEDIELFYKSKFIYPTLEGEEGIDLAYKLSKYLDDYNIIKFEVDLGGEIYVLNCAPELVTLLEDYVLNMQSVGGQIDFAEYNLSFRLCDSDGVRVIRFTLLRNHKKIITEFDLNLFNENVVRILEAFLECAKKILKEADFEFVRKRYGGKERL